MKPYLWLSLILILCVIIYVAFIVDTTTCVRDGVTMAGEACHE